ncbi:MAG: amidohydrolase family protein [Pseudomonadales bacterium]
MSSVIDCDAHVLEPADLWQKYLEPEFRDRAIRIEREDGREKLIIGEQVVLEGVVAGLGGAEADKAQLFSGAMSYIDDNPSDSYDPRARAARLDAWGIEKAIMFPTIGILPFPTDDLALANAYCRAYNNWIAEFCQTVPGRFYPVALVNWRDVDEACIELQRCLRLGFKGLFVPPETIDGRRPGDTHFDRLWAICQDADIPGCFHVIVRFGGAAIPFAAWHETSPGPVFGFGLGGSGQLIPAITSVVTDQLFERFPRLKVVSVEAGCGYAPYLMDRLDSKYEAFKGIVALPKRPSEYIRSNCYFVAEQGERCIDAALELVGSDRILWGSDYPHVDALNISDNLPVRWPQLAENVYKVFPIG